MTFEARVKSFERNPNSIRFRELAYLFRKVTQELGNPKQFVDPKRAISLFRSGTRYLSGISATIEFDDHSIEKNILNSLLIRRESNGLVVAFSENMPMQLVIFPSRSNIIFHSPDDIRRDKFEPNIAELQFIATTTSFVQENDTQNNIPNQGYRDSHGLRFPFSLFDPKLICQYGAIHINGNINIINFEQLMDMRTKQLEEGEILMGANWYMDSGNQTVVLATSEHQQRKIYNCMGIAETYLGQTEYFHLSSQDLFIAKKTFAKRRVGERNVLLAEMAGMVNVMGKVMNWKSWKLAGLEYSGGGLRTNVTGSTYPYFTVKF